MRNHSADFLMYERRTRMAGSEGKMSVTEIILQLGIIKNSIKRICNQKEVYKLIFLSKFSAKMQIQFTLNCLKPLPRCIAEIKFCQDIAAAAPQGFNDKSEITNSFYQSNHLIEFEFERNPRKVSIGFRQKTRLIFANSRENSNFR